MIIKNRIGTKSHTISLCTCDIIFLKKAVESIQNNNTCGFSDSFTDLQMLLCNDVTTAHL